jgi:hypothetical protein
MTTLSKIKTADKFVEQNLSAVNFGFDFKERKTPFP